MDFLINCYIPSLKKQIKINKLCFGDLYQCNLYIQNKDFENLNETFNSICQKSTKQYDVLNNLDKFSILLHLYVFYLNPILKLSAKDNENNKVSYDVFLNDLFNKIKKYNISEFNLPKQLYYSNVNDILKETKENADVIRKHIKTNKIQMFEIPEMIKGISKVYINCFDNSLFHFLRILYSENIKNLFKKIKILKKDYNFLLEEIYTMSPKEIAMFLDTK
jgi:hypothetical protein